MIMLIITVQVDAPQGAAQAVKEALAQYCEYFGDSKVVKIEEVFPEQIRMEELQRRTDPRHR